jgi:steroid delta-isomerase-like uncharacterized protein
MSIADNKAIGRKYFEEFDRRNWDAIGRLLAPGEVAHLPGAPGPVDWPAHQQFAAGFVAAFPDSRHEVHDQIADDDNVVSRYTFRGRHTGELMGIPATNREIAVEGISWFRCQGGLIAEVWTHFDRIGMMAQLGVVPAPPPGEPLPEGTADTPEQLPPASPEVVVTRWFERIDRSGVPDMTQYLTPDWDSHNHPPFPGLATGMKAAWQTFPYALKAFAEFRHEIEGHVTEGEMIATRVTGHGRHTGEFLGIPATGKEVTMSGIGIRRIVDGKMAEHWAQIDAMSLLQQLGAVPS